MSGCVQITLDLHRIATEYKDHNSFNENLFNNISKIFDKVIHKITRTQCYYMSSTFTYLFRIFDDNHFVKSKIENLLDVVKHLIAKKEVERQKIKIIITKTHPYLFNEDQFIWPRVHEEYLPQIDYKDVEVNPNILITMHNILNLRNINQQIYFYLSLKVCNLNIRMQKLKSEILNLEISRYGKLVGNSLDSIINWYLDSYIDLSNQFNMYCKQLKDTDVDTEYLDFIESQCSDIKMTYFINYQSSFNL